MFSMESNFHLCSSSASFPAVACFQKRVSLSGKQELHEKLMDWYDLVEEQSIYMYKEEYSINLC